MSGNSRRTPERQSLTRDAIKEVLDYNPETGVFTWKKSTSSKAKAGARAGMANERGCRVIGVNKKVYQEHHLAWLWVTGVLHSFRVEHIDGDIANNQWRNLKKKESSGQREFDADQARFYIDYDPLTGIMVWSRDLSSRARAGNIVGSLCPLPDGRMYMNMRFMNKYYKQHRFIYGWMTGDLPPKGMDIDHIDGDGLNNRWANLRLATRSQNLQNSKAKKSVTGLKGVTFLEKNGRKRFLSRIFDNGNVRHLGTFKTAQEAHDAYKAAALEARGEFCRFE